MEFRAENAIRGACRASGARSTLRAGWLLALMVALAGCGGDDESDDPGAASGRRTIATKSQVLATAQHALHSGGEVALGCEDCHELVSDEYIRAKSWRCQRCHEKHPLSLHKATSKQSGAQECTTCHDFTGDSLEPTPCMSCHKEAQGQLSAIKPHDPAKPDETCVDCHRAHVEPSLASAACESCHDKTAVTGHQDPKIGITGCASCHGYHEEAVTASARCTNCHRQSRGHSIPTSATFPGGHESCVTCHKQHQFMKSEVLGCKDACHDKIEVLGQTRVKEHGDCRSCHNPHDARASARAACQGCHEKQQKVKHPVDDKSKSACFGCHSIHGGEAKAAAAPCSSCHGKVAGGDSLAHQGKRGRGPACKNCHRPHNFKLSGANEKLCRSCHQGQFKHAKKIRTRKGHEDCIGCHSKKVTHAPKTPPVACASCHKDKGKKVVKGHKKCTGCHEPHSAVRRRLCNQCHSVEAATVPTGHENCQECHEPHDPRFKKSCTDCHDDLDTQKLHTK